MLSHLFAWPFLPLLRLKKLFFQLIYPNQKSSWKNRELSTKNLSIFIGKVCSVQKSPVLSLSESTKLVRQGKRLSSKKSKFLQRTLIHLKNRQHFSKKSATDSLWLGKEKSTLNNLKIYNLNIPIETSQNLTSLSIMIVLVR